MEVVGLDVELGIFEVRDVDGDHDAGLGLGPLHGREKGSKLRALLTCLPSF